MSVIPKDPADWLTLFRQQVDVLFTYLSRAERLSTKQEHEYIPLVDIFETADNHVIEFELPGFEKQDIRLSVCCNTLLLEGIKRKDSRKGFRFIRVERHFGHFARMIEIPPTADINRVTARYDKGTLTVTFPRLHESQEIIRNIPIA